MKPRSAKAKGKLLEKFVCEQLRYSKLDPMARPEVGSGSGTFKGDIATKLPLSIECKNTKSFHAAKFWKQADAQGMGYQEAVVVWHPPHEPMEGSKVMMSWQLFLKLSKAFFKVSS